MAKTKSTELQQNVVDTACLDGKVKCYLATIICAEQASGDTIVIANAKKGERFVYGLLSVSETLATAKVEIGSSIDSDKYKTAEVATTADVPSAFGLVAAQEQLTDDETIALKVSVAALPSTGTIKVAMFFTVNN